MSSTTEAMKREWVAAIQKIMGLLDEGQEVDLIGEEFLKEQVFSFVLFFFSFFALPIVSPIFK